MNREKPYLSIEARQVTTAIAKPAGGRLSFYGSDGRQKVGEFTPLENREQMTNSVTENW